MKRALIFWGGWDGHTPEQTAGVLAAELELAGYTVELVDHMKPLNNLKTLKKFDLITPVWTMGELPKEAWQNLDKAVKSGVGLGGVHGGMADAFRANVEYQWMVGGQFMAHPYIGKYTVRLTEAKSPITKGMKARFTYDSEQYYMLVDPGVKVLAETTYKHEGKRVTMPVIWTKTWGKGRVFFSALGHVAEEFSKYPDVLAMTLRGLQWAAKK